MSEPQSIGEIFTELAQVKDSFFNYLDSIASSNDDDEYAELDEEAPEDTEYYCSACNKICRCDENYKDYQESRLD